MTPNIVLPTLTEEGAVVIKLVKLIGKFIFRHYGVAVVGAALAPLVRRVHQMRTPTPVGTPAGQQPGTIHSVAAPDDVD